MSEASHEARHVARWDLDKTYLRTEFDTARDLIKTALERPDQKRSVPGAAAVLRELGRSGAFIHILSGSPRQMRARLEEKLRIDRVRWDLLTLKPNVSNLLRLRLRAVRDQLGYKLPALLESRRVLPQAAEREILVGDDAEADAFVYSLYADITAGQIDSVALSRILQAGRVYPDVEERCLHALREIKPGVSVKRILIHLERQTPPSRFHKYGPRVVPFYNYLQVAFVLAEDGLLEPAAVLRIASEFALQQRFDTRALARSYHDLMRRGHVKGALAGPLNGALSALLATGPVPAREALEGLVLELGRYQASPPPPLELPEAGLDYLELARRHRRRHRSPFVDLAKA